MHLEDKGVFRTQVLTVEHSERVLRARSERKLEERSEYTSELEIFNYGV